MAVYGYNREEIQQLRTQVTDVAESLANSIKEKFQNQFVNPMGDIWYAPEAITWFDSFKETLDSLSTPLINYFNGYLEALQAAANAWAQTTGGEQIVIAEIPSQVFSLSINSIDYSAIKSENANHDQGIEVDQAQQICSGNLPAIQTLLNEELSAYSSRIEAETSFLGGGQAEAVQRCFGQIAELIKNLFNELTEGENSLPAAITSYINKYKETASANVSGLDSIVSE